MQKASIEGETPDQNFATNVIMKSTKCLTDFYSCCGISLQMVIGFLLVTLYFVPSVAEIICVATFNDESKEFTLGVCGCIQAGLSVLFATLLGYNTNKRQDFCSKKIWCRSITSYKTIISCGHLSFCLLIWFVTNAMSSWILMGRTKNIPGQFGYDISIPNPVKIDWKVHLMIYAPLIVYIPFFTTGFSFYKARN